MAFWRRVELKQLISLAGELVFMGVFKNLSFSNYYLKAVTYISVMVRVEAAQLLIFG